MEQEPQINPRTCDWCQPSRNSGPDTLALVIGKGIFRDFDSDLSDGIPVCGGCGGLGVQYPGEDFENRRTKIMELRFKYCPTDVNERERLTESDRLGTLKQLDREILDREIKELVEIYGGSESKNSFAENIAAGGLSDLIEASEKHIRVVEEARSKVVDPVSAALLEPSIAFTQGRYKAAEEGFKEAIRVFPKSSLVYHDYGVFLAEAKGDLDGAYENFSMSANFEPRKAIHAYQTAKCAVMLGRNKEAVNWLTLAQKMPDLLEFEVAEGVSIDGIIEQLKEVIDSKT